jgi:signal-transduction protein with cAMP-binding, CBS, and nucleotidyltransferase domain
MEDCMQLMTDKRIRHLPVVENGKLFAMISIRDLLESTMQEQKYLIQQLEQYIRGESY